MPVRRQFLLKGVVGAVSALGLAVAKGSPAQDEEVDVWKSPTCGCCKVWIDRLREQGFTVRVFDTGNNAMRGKLGIPAKLGSCHTARVGGYALEGHVPIADIRRLLKERPDAIGLAVPGMPVGSPGMDGPDYGDRRDAYDVLLVLKGQPPRVFSHYNGK